MRRVRWLAVLATIALVVVTVGCDASSATDIWTNNIWTTANNTYQIGDNGTVYSEGWFDRVYITDNTSLLDHSGNVLLTGGTGTSSNVSVLNDLTDVTITTPSTNETLRYNGAQWVNDNVSAGVYTDEQAQDAVGNALATTSSLALQYDDVGNLISGYTTLVHNGMTNMEGIPHGDGVNITDNATLDDLWDVNAAAPSDGQVLTWDNITSRWVSENATAAVNITNATSTNLTGYFYGNGATVSTNNTFTSPTIQGTVGAGTGLTLPAVLMAGAVSFGENVFLLDAAISGDGYASGLGETGTAGVALTYGELVYYNSASKWVKAKADSVTTSSGKLGICVLAAAGDTSPTTVLLWGKVNAAAAFPAMTVGGVIFVSEATAGAVTGTAPSASTNVVRIIGYGNSADELYFFPDRTWIVLA